ncbi:MAG TPA: DNA repair protein RecN [Stellaceae bacterium]|nr:DNA repair protein RecN [Stellaceae bacterium]
MLLGLTIRDVVLIDRLDLAFEGGLSVLTGETGAGKSILLDALGLVLGGRGDSALVRAGATQAIVGAEFDLPADHPARPLLTDQGIEVEDSLLLRRVLGVDGRSRAFVNDQPASIGLLRQLGETLVEIQGQFEQRGLLDPSTHGGVLDSYGGHYPYLEATRARWAEWTAARRSLAAAQAALAESLRDEEWLRHALAEFDALAPVEDEEDSLAERRALLMHREQVGEATETAYAELAGERGAERAMNAAARALDRVRDKSGSRLDTTIAALERGLVELAEAIALLQAATAETEAGGERLEKVEERLFALRALARKHGIAVDQLPALHRDLAARLAALDDGAGGIGRLEQAAKAARDAYGQAAENLAAARRGAAKRLDSAVQAELAPLKLERARFTTAIAPLPDTDWGPDGSERVTFEVATNPGTPAGPLAKIASGGELSRFMLALKVVLARVSSVPTIVFDEVDSGIGGAVAAAVGDRLQKLGDDLQVLVVTHSPQVAARGAHHWRVAKLQASQHTVTRVEPLSDTERREEIARMLSGETITAEARAAADSLLLAGAAL